MFLLIFGVFLEGLKEQFCWQALSNQKEPGELTLSVVPSAGSHAVDGGGCGGYPGNGCTGDGTDYWVHPWHTSGFTNAPLLCHHGTTTVPHRAYTGLHWPTPGIHRVRKRVRKVVHFEKSRKSWKFMKFIDLDRFIENFMKFNENNRLLTPLQTPLSTPLTHRPAV